MPTYEYVCRSCGHLFEVVQSMRDDPLTECPQCGGVLRKVFAPPAISFKGSGFYATDHGKKTAKDSDHTKTDGPAKDSKDSKGAKDSKDAAPASEGKGRPAEGSPAPAAPKDATGS
jgi:putative FmdB family regulatory protein